MLSSLHTPQLHQLLDRIQLDDRNAANELILRYGWKLHAMTQRMLGTFPIVQRWEQLDDVMQQAILRLLKSLQSVRPNNMQEFDRFAAYQVRLELLSLARHYRGQQNSAAHHESHSGEVMNNAPDCEDVSNLERWTAFHEAIDQLPDYLRPVVELRFYSQLSRKEIAEVLHLDPRKVTEYLLSAGATLVAMLGHDLPE